MHSSRHVPLTDEVIEQIILKVGRVPKEGNCGNQQHEHRR